MTKKGWGILLGISGALILGSTGVYFLVIVPKKEKAELEKAESEAALAGKNLSSTAGTKPATPKPADNMSAIEMGDVVMASEKVPLFKSNALIPPNNSPNIGPANVAKYIPSGEKVGIAGPFDGNFLTIYRDESWFGGEASTYYLYKNSKVVV